MMKFVLPRYLYQNMHMASPSLPSVETNHSFGREMIHCVQWMHPTPCVLSETALSGLQFIILAWHEAGKIPAADSPLVFSPLCYNSTFFVWLSLDLGPCLKWVHARHWKTIHVSSWFWTSATHRQSVHWPDRLSMGGRRAGNSTAWLPFRKKQDTGFILCNILWVSEEQDDLCDQVKNLL